MSFLLDPPSLVGIGVLLDRYVGSPVRRARLAAGVVLVFLTTSTLLYLDVLPWWFTDEDGPEWMLNSGLDTDLTRGPGTDVLAVIMFAAYPLWMKLGLDLCDD
ncbi:hypothetical protein [Halorubrum aquaticum]|nr:hypothetical protein [Halorubrum aquaticum]